MAPELPFPRPHYSHRKDRSFLPSPPPNSGSPSVADALNEELLHTILDLLDENPADKKSFSMACKAFYAAESRHRKTLRPLRPDLLPALLARRYRSLRRLDFSLSPRVSDRALSAAARLCSRTLLSVDLSRSKLFSHAGLASLVAGCGMLVEIDLSNGTELTDAAAAAISRARCLERLWLARCKLITDLGIGCIAVGCQRLRLICLKWCLGLTDMGVGLVAVKCKELRSLDLSYVQITKKCIPAILQLPHLEDLILQGCIVINNKALTTLKYGCKSLKTLDMSNLSNVSHDGILSLINGALSLHQLTLPDCIPVTRAFSNALRQLPSLKSLKLDGCRVTTAGLKAIGDWCITLQELSLSKCSGLTDEGLSELLTKLKGLKKLDITCCRQITQFSMARITSCSQLTSLRMESCSSVSKESFTSLGLNCTFLEELDVTDNEIDNAGLTSISKCYNLSSLKIGICLNIADLGLVHVGKHCQKLKEIDLYRSVGVTDAGVAAIANGCHQLQIINLAYCIEITDDSLKSLSKCLKLTTLEVRGCSQISSAGLTVFAMGCKQVTRIDVKKCLKVDDAGMLPLARVSHNLRQVNLSYCSITDVGILALASLSCLQNMTILHVKGLTPKGLAAALLACGSLTKVKLHVAFKSLLSHNVIEHLETRGCMLLWREKPFQAGIDDKTGWHADSESMRFMKLSNFGD